MKKKTKILLIAVVAVVVVAVAIVAILLSTNKKNSNIADNSVPDNSVTDNTIIEEQPTEPAVKLYWNVEQEQYEDPASGMTLRNKNADNEYMILVAADGTQERLRCAEQAIVDKIDSSKIIGLSVDENQLITQAYTLEELNYGQAIWKFILNLSMKMD